MRVLPALVLGVLLLTAAEAKEPVATEPADCKTPVACAMRSVVSVLPDRPAGAENSEEPEGSGVVIGDGLTIVTAHHVIGPAKRILVRTVGGALLDAKVALRDPSTDIAVLKVTKPLPPVKFGPSPGITDRACAIGNSFGLDVSVSCGVVSMTELSGTGFNRIEDFVQTDASVNPGMSGGALVNKDGMLIGMLSAIFTKASDSSIGVNFAVSTALLQRVLDQYRESGRVEHLPPGLLIRPAPRSSGVAGAQVARVTPGSSEEAAGLKQGDVVLFANGRRIKRAGAYQAAHSLSWKSGVLRLKVLRGDRMIDVTVR